MHGRHLSSCKVQKISTISFQKLFVINWIIELLCMCPFSLYLYLQDSFRVVTASQDLSLRVLTWRNDGEHGWTLESRYHLLGGSQTMSRYDYFVCIFISWYFHLLHGQTLSPTAFTCVLEGSRTSPVTTPALWPPWRAEMGKTCWRLMHSPPEHHWRIHEKMLASI